MSGHLKIILKMLSLSNGVGSIEEFQQLATHIDEKIAKCDDKIEYLSNLLPRWREAEIILESENKWFLDFIQLLHNSEKISSLEEGSLSILDNVYKKSVKFYIHEEKLDEIKKTVVQLEKAYSIKFDQLTESLEKCNEMKTDLSEKLQGFEKLNIETLKKYCLLKLYFKEMISKRSFLVIFFIIFCTVFYLSQLILFCYTLWISK